MLNSKYHVSAILDDVMLLYIPRLQAFLDEFSTM